MRDIIDRVKSHLAGGDGIPIHRIEKHVPCRKEAVRIRRAALFEYLSSLESIDSSQSLNQTQKVSKSQDPMSSPENGYQNYQDSSEPIINKIQVNAKKVKFSEINTKKQSSHASFEVESLTIDSTSSFSHSSPQRTAKLPDADSKLTQSSSIFESIDQKLVNSNFSIQSRLDQLPFEAYDEYDNVFGVNCECVIGYVPVPLGIARPLNIDGVTYCVPMATTEGALVASTTRGCHVLSQAGGLTSCVLGDSISRAPVFKAKNLKKAFEVKLWIDSSFETLRSTAESTSRHLKLECIETKLVGNLLFVRISANTDGAMGMNMITRAADAISLIICDHFKDIQLLSVSSNYCVDKKAGASSVNWFRGGRGKSIIVEAFIPAEILSEKLSCTVDCFIEVTKAKCLVGSAIAGVAPSGCNAQASNVVAAIFLATGQDLGHVGTSSSAFIQAEKTLTGDLHVTLTMPNIECGVIGGGTRLSAQQASIALIGLSDKCDSAITSRTLAKVICGAVLAAEISLIAALCTPGELTKAHLALNRPS